MAVAETELISYDVQGRVAVITMRRPPVNAVNYAFIDAIHAAWRRADKDPDVRAIILTSALDKALGVPSLRAGPLKRQAFQGNRKFVGHGAQACRPRTRIAITSSIARRSSAAYRL